MADKVNGIHILDITGIKNGEIYLIPKKIDFLFSALAVARNQEMFYVLGSSSPDGKGLEVFEIVFSLTNLTNFAGENHEYDALKNKGVAMVNRIIDKRDVSDIFVDEKYLWLISESQNEAILNGVSSKVVPSVQSLRLPIVKNSVLSVQKIFAYGRQYLLSLGNNSISIDQIATIPSIFSCLFPKDFPSAYTGFDLSYQMDFYTLYCDQKYALKSGQFESVCKFSFNVTFRIVKSLFESAFSSNFYAFIAALLIGTIVTLFWCVAGIVTTIFLKRKLIFLKQRYEMLKPAPGESSFMEKSKDLSLGNLRSKPEVKEIDVEKREKTTSDPSAKGLRKRRRRKEKEAKFDIENKETE